MSNGSFQLSNPFISFINFNGNARIEHEMVPPPPVIRKVKSDEFTIFKLEAWIWIVVTSNTHCFLKSYSNPLKLNLRHLFVLDFQSITLNCMALWVWIFGFHTIHIQTHWIWDFVIILISQVLNQTSSCLQHQWLVSHGLITIQLIALGIHMDCFLINKRSIIANMHRE